MCMFVSLNRDRCRRRLGPSARVMFVAQRHLRFYVSRKRCRRAALRTVNPFTKRASTPLLPVITPRSKGRAPCRFGPTRRSARIASTMRSHRRDHIRHLKKLALRAAPSASQTRRRRSIGDCSCGFESLARLVLYSARDWHSAGRSKIFAPVNGPPYPRTRSPTSTRVPRRIAPTRPPKVRPR